MEDWYQIGTSDENGVCIHGPGLPSEGVITPQDLTETQALLCDAFRAGFMTTLDGIAFGFYGMWAHEYLRVAAIALIGENPLTDALIEIANRMEATAVKLKIDITRDRSVRCMEPLKPWLPEPTTVAPPGYGEADGTPPVPVESAEASAKKCLATMVLGEPEAAWADEPTALHAVTDIITARDAAIRAEERRRCAAE